MQVFQIRADGQGRILIPAAVRNALGIRRDTRMGARIEGRRLVIETHASILADLRARFAKGGRGKSLVDELLADRRREVRREARTRTGPTRRR